MTRLTSMDYSAESRTANSPLSREQTWSRTLLRKVPEVTALFWGAKVLAASASENIGDMLSRRLDLGLAAPTAIASLVFVVVLIWQLSTTRYVPGPFWLTVVLIGAVGSLLSADVVDGLGASPWVAATVLLVAFGLVLAAWYLSENTISVHTVVTRRRELWYWSAGLLALSLGTALGDLVSSSLHLSPPEAVLLFSGVLASVAFAFHRFRVNALLAFWTAYIVTLPLGAALGDLYGTAMTSHH